MVGLTITSDFYNHSIHTLLYCFYMLTFITCHANLGKTMSVLLAFLATIYIFQYCIYTSRKTLEMKNGVGMATAKSNETGRNVYDVLAI